MTKTLSIFAQQVTSVRADGGRGGQAGRAGEVPGVAGTWKEPHRQRQPARNNLTAQVRNIADVTTSVAKGDLSRKITVDAKGEVLELKNTINTMVDQLNAFTGEVRRVAREVGTEGRLGGQAEVEGRVGGWKDLTDKRELHGLEPDRAGAQHRQGHHRGRQRRPLAEDHRRREGRDAGAEEHHQHDGGPAQTPSPPR